jgi:hypothetical protein
VSKPRAGFVRLTPIQAKSARTRQLNASRLAGRGVHTESLPNVRRFTSSPYESLVTGNTRAF